MSMVRNLRVFLISVIFLLILLFTSCKTCDCPAYSRVPDQSPAPEVMANTFQNVVYLPEVTFLQTIVVSGTTSLPYPRC